MFLANVVATTNETIIRVEWLDDVELMEILSSVDVDGCGYYVCAHMDNMVTACAQWSCAVTLTSDLWAMLRLSI
jgi:hypothetical protein